MDETSYPIRKCLNHSVPAGIDSAAAFYFVTVCAADRNGSPFLPAVAEILDSVRFRQNAGIWFVSLFLIMPDHIHMIVHVPPACDGVDFGSSVGRRGPSPPHGLPQVISSWKHFLARKCGIKFQRDFFETRIRDDAHYAEKWDYIVRNPVARGLVSIPREWPHVIAFDRVTGEERKHR